MWYLIAGKLMSVVSYFVFYKVALDPTDLNLLDRLFGWFFFEHVFEEYAITAGKFFLINEDFRTLITNVLIVIRNILILSHFLTLTEFLLTISVLLLLTYFLFYFLKINKIGGKKNEVGILIYYTFVIYILLIKTFVSFDLFDIYFIFKPISALVITLFVPSIFFWLCLKRYYKASRLNKSLKSLIFFVKTILYLLCSLTIGLIFINSLATTNFLSNNFLQEFLVRIVIIYTCIYYSY